MLKIRDDVDLKELEKFGFYKTAWKDSMSACNGDLNINTYSRKLYVYTSKTEVLNVLYDLIKSKFSRESRGIEYGKRINRLYRRIRSKVY